MYIIDTGTINPLEWEAAYNGPGYGGQRTPFGVLYSIPFDQHFLMSLFRRWNFQNSFHGRSSQARSEALSHLLSGNSCA